jgi:integral membrane sensor domain MASE1
MGKEVSTMLMTALVVVAAFSLALVMAVSITERRASRRRRQQREALVSRIASGSGGSKW